MMWVLAWLACSDPPPPEPKPMPYVLPPAGQAPPPPGSVLEELPTSGQSCTSHSQCGEGRCYCAKSHPPGGSPATGFCWDGPVRKGVWWCTIEDGYVIELGVIVP